MKRPSYAAKTVSSQAGNEEALRRRNNLKTSTAVVDLRLAIDRVKRPVRTVYL